MHLKHVLAAIILTAAAPVFAQVTPSATRGGLPLVVGGGYSNFNTDWSGRIEGTTVWVDWNFYSGPAVLHGFGIEAEARDLNYGWKPSLKRMRFLTGGGGPIYTWRHYRNIHPYAKFIIGLGGIDFYSRTPYDHDTRTVYAPGGGIEYRGWHNVWVRADYQYQFWTNFFNHNALNPAGVTIGATYDFRRGHHH